MEDNKTESAEKVSSGEDSTATQGYAPDGGRELHYRRRQDFSILIMAVARHNPLVNRIVDAYCHGDIITMDEALCRMVVALDQNWAAVHKKYFDAAMNLQGHLMSTAPLIKPEGA